MSRPKAHAFSTGGLSYSHALNPPFPRPSRAPFHSKVLNMNTYPYTDRNYQKKFAGKRT